MSKYKYEKEFMFSSRKLDQIEIFLQNQEQPLDLMVIRDGNKNTVIHHCCYHNQVKVLQYYIRYYRKNMENKKMPFSEIKLKTKILLNQVNHQGYAAAHYAAYRGNVTALKILQKYQATLQLQSGLKMSLLHMAAQGDKVNTILYLHNKQFNINSQDVKGSTALHWAAFSSSQKVVQYLLAQPNLQIDLKDQQGQTPLHLATAYGNIKIVKKLLLSGADRHITNDKGQSALQLAQVNEFNSIAGMLDDKYSLLDYLKFLCNIRTKYQPKNRSIFQPICFVLIFICLTTLNFMLIKPVSLVFLGLQTFIFSVTIVLYLSLIVGPRQLIKTHSYSDYAESQKIMKLCMQCIRPTKLRQNHCPICHRCIAQYDHHCNWINNCIGANNLARFIFFLLFTQTILLWFGYLGVRLMIMTMNGQKISWLIQINSWIYENQMEWVLYVSSVIFMLLVLCFAFPLLCLILIQMKNLLLGKTTYQRFTKSNQSILTREGSDFLLNSSDSRPTMSLRNCVWMCCSGQERVSKVLQQTASSTHSSFSVR